MGITRRVLLIITYITILLFNLKLIECRGHRIDIFNQGGHGDIKQLRMDVNEHTVLRNALPRNSQNKWDKMRDTDGYFLIPYVVSGDYDSRERSIISAAMKTIEANTCIRFKPRYNEQDFIDIQNKRNEGCYTNVGRDPGQNVVMLEANNIATCVEPDIVIHELLHTIGLWHEHMREDRDNYIKVMYKNIDPAYFSQFTKVTSDEAVTYGIPYDYTSVMHYGETAFAKPGLISMQTKNPSFQKVIGHQGTASPSDYKKVCLIYSCPTCKGANELVRPQPAPPPVLSISGMRIEDTNYNQGVTPESSSCRGDRLPSFICNVMLSNNIVSCESAKLQTFCCQTCANKKQPMSISVGYQNAQNNNHNNNGFFSWFG